MGATSLRDQIRDALAVIEQLRADNAVLLAQNEELSAANASLRDRVAHLESEQKKNSTTSSKPPSTDPMATRQSRAQRRAEAREANRRQAKKPGAPGTNLARRTPGVVVGHRPVCCEGCGAELSGASVIGEIRRQVIDLPAVTPTVTDHVARSE